LALGIDGQDNCLDLVAFLERTYRFFAWLIPGNVGQVNQTIDVAFETDEDTEVSDGLDVAGDAIAFLVSLGEAIPWVLVALFDTQGDTTSFFVDIQDHHMHYVAQLYHFGWVNVLVGPVHLGDV